jgi:hypothetical protein
MARPETGVERASGAGNAPDPVEIVDLKGPRAGPDNGHDGPIGCTKASENRST